MFQQVTFRLNKILDKKMAFEFLNLQQGGIDFSHGIIEMHPALKKIKEIKGERKQKQFISDHFESFYNEHYPYLNKWTKEANKTWERVAREFFNATRQIFKGHPFPPGEYIGYLSIVDCNPRFLKDKTFQVFHLHPLGVKYVTAHELLHFMFYDYALKKYPKVFMKMDTERGIFWDLAELFNSIILHTQIFVQIHQVKRKVVYPEHRKCFPCLFKVWKKYHDIDKFITISYKLLKNDA